MSGLLKLLVRVNYSHKSVLRIWWFASVAFPLVAGTFGPIANLCSVCALVQRWRTSWIDGEEVPDPPW